MDYKKSTYKKKTAAPKVQYKPKRGKLAPLMSENEKASAGIHELSYDFGCRITRLFQYLTEDSDYKEFVISKRYRLRLCEADMKQVVVLPQQSNYYG